MSEKLVWKKEYAKKVSEEFFAFLNPSQQAEIAAQCETFNATKETFAGMNVHFAKQVAKSDILKIGNILRDMVAIDLPVMPIFSDDATEETKQLASESFAKSMNDYALATGSQFATIAEMLTDNSIPATSPCKIKSDSKISAKEAKANQLIRVHFASGIKEGLSTVIGEAVDSYTLEKFNNAIADAKEDEEKIKIAIKSFGVRGKGGKANRAASCMQNEKYTAKGIVAFCKRLNVKAELIG
jgi:hypothetical protein